MRKGVLPRNPALLADPPKRDPSAPQRDGEMQVWTAQQLQSFLRLVDGQRLAPALVVTAHTGMRRGEVAGLRWADIDVEKRLIHIRQAIVVVEYALEFTDLKSDNGERTIDVNDATASFMLDVYGWVLPGMQAEAAATFSRLMAVPSDDDVEAGETGGVIG